MKAGEISNNYIVTIIRNFVTSLVPSGIFKYFRHFLITFWPRYICGRLLARQSFTVSLVWCNVHHHHFVTCMVPSGIFKCFRHFLITVWPHYICGRLLGNPLLCRSFGVNVHIPRNTLRLQTEGCIANTWIMRASAHVYTCLFVCVSC